MDERGLYSPEKVDPLIESGEHPAFSLALLRESEAKERFQDTLGDLGAWVVRWFDWMKASRRSREIEWQKAEELYTLDDVLKEDYNRSSSAFSQNPDEADDVRGKTRAAVNLPVAHDNVEQIVPRFYESLFGSDPNGYCETKPREKNDALAAEAAAELLNFQQSNCSNTPVEGYRFCRDAALYGEGYLAQWFEGGYRRRTIRIAPRDIWADPAALDLQKSRFVVWRSRLTVGELREMRDEKEVAFTDRQLSEVAQSLPDDTLNARNANEPTATPDSENTSPYPLPDDLQEVILDYWFEPGRMILLLNEILVVGIIENPLAKDAEAEQAGEHLSDVRYPIVQFMPIPDLDTDGQTVGPHGISHVYLSKSSVDFQNSVMWLMNRNLARGALGLFFGDTNNLDPAQANKILQAGKIYSMRDPKNSLLHVQLPDVSAPCMNSIGFMQKFDDRLYGITDAFRGEQQYSAQTASATNQLANEASKRAGMALTIGQQTMRQFWEIGLRLNRKFLDPKLLPRVLGEKSIWAEQGRGVLYAVSGIDIMPTGAPQSGTKAYLSQNGLNLCTVIAQFKTMGFNVDPTPLLRDTIKAMGIGKADEIVPDLVHMGFDPAQENEQLLQGIPIEVGPYDNDKSHLDGHMPLFYIPEARDAFKANPVLFQAFIAHLQNHAGRLDMQEPGSSSGVMKQVEGFGGGQGTPGTNTQPIAPDPKQGGEVEAQVNAATPA